MTMIYGGSNVCVSLSVFYVWADNKPVISPITGLEIPPILTEAVVFRDMIRRYIDNELKARETRRAQGGP